SRCVAGGAKASLAAEGQGWDEIGSPGGSSIGGLEAGSPGSSGGSTGGFSGASGDGAASSGASAGASGCDASGSGGGASGSGTHWPSRQNARIGSTPKAPGSSAGSRSRRGAPPSTSAWADQERLTPSSRTDSKRSWPMIAFGVSTGPGLPPQVGQRM